MSTNALPDWEEVLSSAAQTPPDIRETIVVGTLERQTQAESNHVNYAPHQAQVQRDFENGKSLQRERERGFEPGM